jgi:hypothetical protein
MAFKLNFALSSTAIHSKLEAMTFGFRCALLLLLAVLMAGMLTCARDQQLVSITVQPGVENFGASNIPVSDNAGLSVQLRALGNYIHPPVTKDITNQVTWASNDLQMFTITSTGLLTATGDVCGGTLVSATQQTNTAGNRSSSGAIVTGNMQANVICFTGTGGGGSGPLLTVNFPGTGVGSVASTPPGINCATTCSATFANGTPVNITATAGVGSTFGGWGNCDAVTGQNGQTCIIDSLTADRTVTVTFN